MLSSSKCISGTQVISAPCRLAAQRPRCLRVQALFSKREVCSCTSMPAQTAVAQLWRVDRRMCTVLRMGLALAGKDRIRQECKADQPCATCPDTAQGAVRRAAGYAWFCQRFDRRGTFDAGRRKVPDALRLVSAHLFVFLADRHWQGRDRANCTGAQCSLNCR